MGDAWRQDIRFALRHLGRAPGFVAASVVTLALAVGANAALFSMINGLSLRPLAIADPDGLIGVSSRNARDQMRLTLIPAVLELQREGPLERVCAINGGGVFPAEANGTPTQVTFALVTGGCFSTFGVPPVLGRAIDERDAPITADGHHVAVISHRFWTRMFGRDPGVIGKPIRMEGVELAVIGVMPEGFGGLQADAATEIFVPFYTVSPRRPDRPSGATHILGRLKPGVDFEGARAELMGRWPAIAGAIVPATLAAAERDEFLQTRAHVERLATGVSGLRATYARPLSLVFGLTAVLLILACVNLGGLLLARLAARAPELVTRLALGAGRWRLARQMVIESVLLAMAGSALAVPLAFGLVAVITAFLPLSLVDRTTDFRPDAGVLGVTALSGLVAGILMSLLPTVLAWRQQGVRSFGWDRTIAGTTGRWARGLLVAQVAIAVVMLTGAGLLARSLYLLQQVDTGVRTANLLAVRVMPLPNAYRGIDNTSYFPTLAQRLEALPGVRSVGFARSFPRFPLTTETAGQPVTFAGDPPGEVRALLESASPGFFETVGVPLLAGRLPAWTDTATSERVAFVSEDLARRLSADGDVAGRRIRFGADRNHQDVVIAGVVGNLTLGNLRQANAPVFYRPTLQAGLFANYPSLIVATHGDPLALAPAVREAIAGLGREYAHDVSVVHDVLQAAPRAERMSTTLAIAMAGIAALLAFVGVYGLLAYSVARRTREIGVRVALGADRGRVTRMIMRDGLVLVGMGLAIGVPAALASARWLRGLTFGISTTDPVVLAATIVCLLVIGLSAGVLPSRRASRIDPMVALRQE